ncbi:DnaJ family domain-containing protein [Peribacillus sp. FSL H8-0477]|uniref:DnaJ family domain-containing protein n=1 Tax=Peribacillus sp. FSL H8-0477 TaxID=2921388 RepID=UPI0030F7217B
MADRKNEHVNWMDSIYKEYEKDGGLKNNPGYGKPLPKTTLHGSIYDNFLNTAKQAGYLPPWIKLQQDIRKLVLQTVTLKSSNEFEGDLEPYINELNEKVAKYNSICPSRLQRGLFTEELLEQQYDHWR